MALIHGLDPAAPRDLRPAHGQPAQDNGLRVNEVFAETDVAVMHTYPMYTGWARCPLDPDRCPIAARWWTALCGKPVLMEEWGGCTAPPGAAVQSGMGGQRAAMRQFMASEDDLAAYVAAVLPRLVAVGATGAMLWCFADYRPDLWDGPPLPGESRHERFFGLVRPDGSLKPHAEVLRRFAATHPQVARPPAVKLRPGGSRQYYRDPPVCWWRGTRASARRPVDRPRSPWPMNGRARTAKRACAGLRPVRLVLDSLCLYSVYTSAILPVLRVVDPVGDGCAADKRVWRDDSRGYICEGRLR